MQVLFWDSVKISRGGIKYAMVKVYLCFNCYFVGDCEKEKAYNEKLKAIAEEIKRREAIPFKKVQGE